MVMKLGKSILRNKNSSKFWHRQNYVILITLFSKENFFFCCKRLYLFTQNKLFIGKGSCPLQTNTASKPQKIKCNWQKLKEISKLLFIIRSSKQGRGLGRANPWFRFFKFSSKKTKFLPELNLLVENLYLFMNK